MLCRVCRKCKVAKPLDEEHFHRHKDYFRRVCRECRKAEWRVDPESPRKQGSGAPRGPKSDKPAKSPRYDSERRHELQLRESRSEAEKRIAGLVRQYIEIRDATCGRGEAYRSAHDELETALRNHGRFVVAEGREWRVSPLTGGIVSHPLARTWQPSDEPTPAHVYRGEIPESMRRDLVAVDTLA